MKILKLSYILIASATAAGLLVTSCKQSETINTTPNVATGVQLSANARFGTILTDNTGRSLYFFSKDVSGTSTCVDGCATLWLPFYQDNIAVGTGIAAIDIGVITRTGGAKQNTFKGWPLYYYANDTKAGDTNGDAVGNLWAIAKADYTVMFGNAQLVGLDGVQYNDQSLAGTGSSQFITDANGRTLYTFTKDTFKANTFTNSTFSNDNIWPIYTVTAVASVPTVLDKTQFSIISVFGRNQLVFRGHPMYFFGQDASTRGNTKGVSFPTPGAAIWKVQNNNTVVLQ